MRALLGDYTEYFEQVGLEAVGWDGGLFVLLGALALALLAALFSALSDQLKKRLGKWLETDHIFLLALLFVLPAAVAVAVGRWRAALFIAALAGILYLVHRRRPFRRISPSAIVALLLAIVGAYVIEGVAERRSMQAKADAETVFGIMTFNAPGEGAARQADLLHTTRDFHRLLRESFSALPKTVFRPDDVGGDDVLKVWRLPHLAREQLSAEGREAYVLLENEAARQAGGGPSPRSVFMTQVRVQVASLDGRDRQTYEDNLRAVTAGPDDEALFLLNHLLLQLAEKLRDSKSVELDPQQEDLLARRILTNFEKVLVLKGLEDSSYSEDASALGDEEILALGQVGQLLREYRGRFEDSDLSPKQERQLAKALLFAGFSE